MFWYNKTVVEFDLVQHQISFAWSSDVRLSFASPSITCTRQNKSDVGLGLIQQLFIIVYLLAQYELSCNLIGSPDVYYQRILPFRSVMLHSQGR